MKKLRDTTHIIGPDYLQFIEDLKARVISARVTAARAITHEAILLFWDIGRGIVEKQQSHSWGDSVVEMVAADLRRAFPESKSFSSDNVWRVRQLYSEYADPLFLAQAVPKIKNVILEFWDRLSQNWKKPKFGYNLHPNPFPIPRLNFCDSLSQKFHGGKTSLSSRNSQFPPPGFGISAPPPALAGRGMSCSIRSREAPTNVQPRKRSPTTLI